MQNKQSLSSSYDHKIPHRPLGKSGYLVSEIGLGCWQLGGDFGPVSKQQVNAILNAADESGVSFWDTADVYGSGQSEQWIGDWCKSNAKQRIIGTKFGRNDSLYPNGYTPENIRKSIEGSLERLQLSSIPLIQLHCIPEEMLNDDILWHCLDDLTREGLVDNVAASVETIEQAHTCLGIPAITSLQIILNIFRQDACETLLAAAKDADVGILARLPLASGLLSGKMNKNTVFSNSDHRNYNRDGNAFSVGETFSGLPYAKGLELVELIRELVPDGMSMSQFALRWCLDQHGVSSVLAGASSPEQVRDNAAASTNSPLPQSTHQALADLYIQKIRPYIRGKI